MKPNRRKFIQTLGAASLLAASESFAKPFHIIKDMRVSPNDKIRFATIGMGIQGNYDTRAALKAGGTELVAAADLYDGRLTRVKELFGKDIFTTRDYREILSRKDIDAVLVVTPDHWHDHITIDALKAGKAVYCEKPMVNRIEKGKGVIEAWKKSGKTMQVGSQRISGSAFAEARRMINAGDIGHINFIEGTYDRFNAIGAWNYSIPTDASPATLDWDRFLGDAPKRPFDATRFFRWRNYRDYGTGVAGDLFVHLITGVHYMTGSHGPERIFSSGEQSYWKDGRDIPDVLVSVFDYPANNQHEKFQMVLRVNFANAGAIRNVTRIIGTEGQIEVGDTSLVLTRRKLPKAPGYGNYDSYFTFSEAQQAEFKKQYDQMYPEADRVAEPVKEIKFDAPKEEDSHANHFNNFFTNVREGSQNTIEDPVFGFRAAAPVLACNDSYFQQKVIRWDADKMILK
ncbi:Gfo/Idh/MocA family protein [Leadbetterella sp. DM7]|uniref:Gfo/Idh/MocA family protein n=1 Tax=Leadbetterella sp. DM7 TaxID=3235085 RepID=UPI00349E96B9